MKNPDAEFSLQHNLCLPFTLRQAFLHLHVSKINWPEKSSYNNKLNQKYHTNKTFRSVHTSQS